MGHDGSRRELRCMLLAIFAALTLVPPLWASGAKESYHLSAGAQTLLSSLFSIRDKALMGPQAGLSSPSAYARKYSGMFQALTPKIEGLTNASDRTLLEAVQAFELFQVYQVAGEQDAAFKEITDAQSLMKKAIDKEGAVTAVSLRVYGDIQTRMITYKGGMQVVTLSQDAKRLYERALQLDKRLALAYIGLATWYLYAPDIAGGDARKTLGLVHTARTFGGAYARYLSYVWEAYAYAKLLQPSRALAAVASGLALVPGDRWLERIHTKLTKGESLFTSSVPGA